MSFVCNNCSKFFSTKQSLNRHYQRKYKCVGVQNDPKLDRGYQKRIIFDKFGYQKRIILTLKKNHLEKRPNRKQMRTKNLSAISVILLLRTNKTNIGTSKIAKQKKKARKK